MLSMLNNLRSALARRFYVALKRASHRMPSQLIVPERSRVLLIAPHMDDEVIGCGGTLLLHKALGSAVRVVFVSDSSGGVGDAALGASIRAARHTEMVRVCAALALESVSELGFPDGALVRHEQAIASRLAAELADFRPAQVLCPFPLDGHSDHQATAVAFGAAAKQAGWRGEVLAYEVWSALWPNAGIDIGAVAERKAELIGKYASQMGDRDYVAAILGLNRYRGMVHRLAFAEAFHRCSPAQFAELTACLDKLDRMSGQRPGADRQLPASTDISSSRSGLQRPGFGGQAGGRTSAAVDDGHGHTSY